MYTSHVTFFGNESLSPPPSHPMQGQLALCACTHRFVSAVEGKKLMAASEKAKENEILKVTSIQASCG